MSDLCNDIENHSDKFGDILSDSHGVILWDNIYVHNTLGLHQESKEGTIGDHLDQQNFTSLTGHLIKLNTAL